MSKNGCMTRRDLIKGLGIATAATLLPSSGNAGSIKSNDESESFESHFKGPIPNMAPEGYNILLITCDQERYFDKYPFPVPGRERIIRNGVKFTNHQNTANVCTPSRSVMYTGLHMPQTRMFDNLGFPWMNYDLDPELKTIGHMMQELGYYTTYHGKWHLTRQLGRPLPSVPNEKITIGKIPVPDLNCIMEKYGFSDYQGIGDIIGSSKGGYFFDSLTTGQALSWLRTKGRPLTDENKPWFMALNLVNPHDVMYIDTDNPGEEVQWKKEEDQNNHSMNPTQPPNNKIYKKHWPDFPLPENRHQQFDEPGRPKAHKEYQEARSVMEGQFPDEDRRWRKLLDYYSNCIIDSDQHIVQILNELDNLELTDKTIIVLTADHGEMGGAHQMHGKGSSVYKEQIHVPMVISHPAYPGNQMCDSLTCHLDLVPTLVGLTGIKKDKLSSVLRNRKGKDMSQLLSTPQKYGVNDFRNASLYCYGMLLYADSRFLKEFTKLLKLNLPKHDFEKSMSELVPDYRKRSAIRMINDGHYKFARYFSLKEHNTPLSLDELFKLNDVELYDLDNDPGENVNLAMDPVKNKGILEVMNQKLNDLIKKEIGIDDGSFMPCFDGNSWSLSAQEFHQLFND